MNLLQATIFLELKNLFHLIQKKLIENRVSKMKKIQVRIYLSQYKIVLETFATSDQLNFNLITMNN